MNAKIYKCFVASPNDTQEERNICDTVFNRINKTQGEQLNFRIESKKWEKDVYPSFGKDGQDVINKQILLDYDMFIGIMWNKFGTSTPRAGSGTEEEFNDAYRRFSEKEDISIMFYFNKEKADIDSLDLDQVSKVRSFKKKVSELGGLYMNYNGKEEFEKVLYDHLFNYFSKKKSDDSKLFEKHPDVKIKTNDKTLKDNNDISNIETIHQALDLFINQKGKLDHKTTFEEFEEVEKLKSELFNNLFGEYKQKINSIPVLKNKSVITLFENIMSSEKLSKTLINDIINIRNDNENYKFYHRSVIVSALTLSVLSWKKFDSKKVGILIDFLTDFEDEVWERALTGIILSIIVHQNRLKRQLQLTNRLVELQKNERIQIGIYVIDTILRNQLYENVLFPDEFEKNNFLNKTPYNWFFPFYKENPILNKMLEQTEQDIEDDSFLDFIYNVPFVSSYKYTICNGIKENKIQVFKKNKNNISQDDIIKIQKLNTAYELSPYYNLISEFYLYYKFYPKERVAKIFNSKITLAETRLKNIILSKVQTLKLTADLLFEKKEYRNCISNLKELLNIEHNQLSALIQISKCHELLKEYSEALTYHYEIEKLKPDNFYGKYSIGFCLRQIKQYKKSNEYLFLANSIVSDKVEVLNLIGQNYLSLKKYSESIKFHKKVLLKEPDHINSVQDLSICYSHIDKPEQAIKYSKLLYKLNPKDPQNIILLALDHVEIGENEKAEELASDAFVMQSNSCQIAFGYARILFVNKKYDKAELLFNKALQMKDADSYRGVILGNLGHISLFKNNEKEYIDYYQRCVLEFDESIEFEKKFDTDLQYALHNKITKKKYNSIKQKMIQYWQENN